jgi:hypothetical protein
VFPYSMLARIPALQIPCGQTENGVSIALLLSVAVEGFHK